MVYLKNGEVVAGEPLADFIAFHRQLGISDKLETILLQYEKEGQSYAAKRQEAADAAETAEKPAE